MSFYGDIQRWWVGTVEEASGQSDPEHAWQMSSTY